MKGIPDVARHAPVTVTECTDTDNFPYPQVVTIMQKVGTKSIDKPWQNCARKLSEKQTLLFRGSSVLRRLGEIHARWKVWKIKMNTYYSSSLFDAIFQTLLQMQNENISIKHDLARSCFQFWLKIGDEGGKILKKKTGEALAETVFFSKFCHPRSRFWEPKLKTWSRQIMFYVIYPELWKLLKKMKIL